ncbi:alpha-galactosidase [candidate division KSB1 bacterium]|nr:alpha-galactosidase [candidate division KSB1 bacterium]
MRKNVIISILLIIISHIGFTQQNQDFNLFQIENNRIKLTVECQKGMLYSEKISFSDNNFNEMIKTDGDFAFEIVWTDWMSPGMDNNAENPVTLSKKDFKFVNYFENNLPDGIKQVEAFYKGRNQHLQLSMTYLIEPDNYYVKRKIAIRDTLFQKHFLHQIRPLDARLNPPEELKIIKEGGFGQPVAFQFKNRGVFYGLEYPASTNTIKLNNENSYQLTCAKYVGKKISSDWIESDWVVLGFTPDTYVKKWFMDYVDDLKVAPNTPYTLYNTWYDLRSENYPVGGYTKWLQEENYMNKRNVLRLYQSIRKNFIDKYDVPLNAFVLDDGWDVYASNWQLNKTAFPDGMSPIVDEFKQGNTQLGMWFGPTGGYSARMKRINWYRENGYEVVGEEKQWGGAQLCLAGKNYSKLFKKRTLEFVKQGVAFYKWDGIQFSCSEAYHGHPIGLYSQIAVLDTLISTINAIHQVNPNVYHSITSGTWLSPWWLKYANQIWMQGQDYGYADVPSYNQRDAAITYRDLTLYDDFHKKKFWFPISNMMTHGLIKGKIEVPYLGESLDKFADNAILYFARGVSMYELYTSPDNMNDAQWQVIAHSLKWAKDNFSVLMNTEMVGGDPGKKQTYGFLHLKENKGIVAARNPYIENQKLEIELSPEFGLDDDAKNLVLEKVYPYRWVSPEIYKSGDKISLPLDGYETAIYEIYPIEESQEPFIAGVPFDSQLDDQGNWIIRYYKTKEAPKLLNKKIVKKINYQGNKITSDNLPVPPRKENEIITNFSAVRKDSKIEIDFEMGHQPENATIGFLLKSRDRQKAQLPMIEFILDGELIQPKFNGSPVDEKFNMSHQKSGWYTIQTELRKHHLVLDMKNKWSGDIDIWSIDYQFNPCITLKIETNNKCEHRIFPPHIAKKGSFKENIKLGAINVD